MNGRREGKKETREGVNERSSRVCQENGMTGVSSRTDKNKMTDQKSSRHCAGSGRGQSTLQCVLSQR